MAFCLGQLCPGRRAVPSSHVQCRALCVPARPHGGDSAGKAPVLPSWERVAPRRVPEVSRCGPGVEVWVGRVSETGGLSRRR